MDFDNAKQKCKSFAFIRKVSVAILSKNFQSFDIQQKFFHASILNNFFYICVFKKYKGLKIAVGWFWFSFWTFLVGMNDLIDGMIESEKNLNNSLKKQKIESIAKTEKFFIKFLQIFSDVLKIFRKILLEILSKNFQLFASFALSLKNLK